MNMVRIDSLNMGNNVLLVVSMTAVQVYLWALFISVVDKKSGSETDRWSKLQVWSKLLFRESAVNNDYYFPLYDVIWI